MDRPDLLTGGFPCQDISDAGKRAGISGTRSGLWKYMAHCVRLVRPKIVLVENVAAIAGRGMGVVVGDLAEIGYDTEWHCIPACAVGAIHRRDRMWIIAHPQGERCGAESGFFSSFNQETMERRKEPSKLQRHLQERPGVPYVCRDHDGISNWVDATRAIGNAIYPAVAQEIFLAMKQTDAVYASKGDTL